MKNTKDKCGIRGFSRVQIVNPKTGEIVGDSGRCGPNQITIEGFNRYLCALLGKTTNSKQVGFMSLGEGGTPATNAVTLPTECSGTNGVPQRQAVTVSIVDSKTLRFTGTFASSNSFVTATEDISNIGLFFATTTDDTLFAGNTFASSSCAVNQNVNATYDIEFS